MASLNIRGLKSFQVRLALTATPRFKAVFFDLDGTLVEFKFKVRESRIALIELLKSKGFDVSLLNEATRTQLLVDEAERQWAALNLLKEKERFDVLKKEIYSILDDFEFQALREAKLHDDSLQILRRLASENISMALVTNSGRRPVDSVLHKFGFQDYLSVVVTRDEMKKMKPMPDGILLALERMGLQSRDVLYVGDSVIDVEAARSAKMWSASVATGLFSKEALEKMSPDFLLGRLEDLENVVFGR